MSESTNTPTLRILLVENHIDTLRSLTMFLEDLGHTVCSARTVAEAVVAWPLAKCDVLISDIGLPDGTGWELLQRINSSQPVYAIAMSGFGMNADSNRSQAAGFRYHFRKPFKTADLERVLGEAAAELAKSEIYGGKENQ